MRCYLMKGGRIQSIVILRQGSDEELIQQAETLLASHREMGIEGVEVWDETRFVLRWLDPPESNQLKAEVMRCYLIRKGMTYGVEYLNAETDSALTEQAMKTLQRRAGEGFDAVSVWSGDRLVGRFRLDQISN